MDLEQQGSSKEDLSGGEDDPPPVDVMNESPDEDKTDDGEETDDEDIKRDELVDGLFHFSLTIYSLHVHWIS